jgi:2-polyprenyl-6-methoxyphenol hydroxylase-like FAD-dependent oxidoreductase
MRPYHVAIVGSGPSGFFAAASLLKAADTSDEIDLAVDMLEFKTIADEVITHFREPGTDLVVKIEIEATDRSGFDDAAPSPRTPRP